MGFMEVTAAVTASFSGGQSASRHGRAEEEVGSIELQWLCYYVVMCQWEEDVVCLPEGTRKLVSVWCRKLERTETFISFIINLSCISWLVRQSGKYTYLLFSCRFGNQCYSHLINISHSQQLVDTQTENKVKQLTWLCNPAKKESFQLLAKLTGSWI